MTKKKYESFGMKDKIGYMLGDMANDFSFLMASMFLMVFYTDVLRVDPKMVGLLFFVARICDAFTDIGMGRIVDIVPPAKDGKFKPRIRRVAPFVCVASFLMYQTSLQNASDIVKIIYMFVTYLLRGSICYTAINIPYGSMASAVTQDTNQRTELSTFRSVGATLASLFIGVFVPLIIYAKDSAGNQITKTDATFTVLAGVFSIIAFLAYMLCYKRTTERVAIKTDKNTVEPFFKTLAELVHSRSLVGIILAALAFLVGQMMPGAINGYLFPKYYNSSIGLSITNFINPMLTIFIAAPLGLWFAGRYGKKEMSSVAMFVSAAFYVIAFIIRPNNMYVYIALAAAAYIAFSLFNTTIWSSITDVIDDCEVEFEHRNDGTIYSLYSRARKLGQAIAGGLVGWMLSAIGYDSTLSVQSEATLSGIFNLSTLIPAISLALCGAVLMFIYPLTKEKVRENAEKLQQKRGE